MTTLRCESGAGMLAALTRFGIRSPRLRVSRDERMVVAIVHELAALARRARDRLLGEPRRVDVRPGQLRVADGRARTLDTGDRSTSESGSGENSRFPAQILLFFIMIFDVLAHFSRIGL